MDALELQTLASELEADVLSRAYNVIEQMARRVAKVFENNVDDQRGWHTELIRRLSISLETGAVVAVTLHCRARSGAPRLAASRSALQNTWSGCSTPQGQDDGDL